MRGGGSWWSLVGPRDLSPVAAARSRSLILHDLVDGRRVMYDARMAAPHASVSAVAASTSAVDLRPGSNKRKGLFVFNDSTAVLYVKFGADASSTDHSFQVQPDGYFEMPMAGMYTGRITGAWAAADGHARVTEIYG